jgi:O-antigen/teichoic acid export membrane protein
VDIRRAVSINVVGETTAKALLLVANLILARSLGPEQFGAWSAVFALFSYLLVMTEFGTTIVGVSTVANRVEAGARSRLGVLVRQIASTRLVVAVLLTSLVFAVTALSPGTDRRLELLTLLGLGLCFHAFNLDWYARGLKQMTASVAASLVHAVIFLAAALLSLLHPALALLAVLKSLAMAGGAAASALVLKRAGSLPEIGSVAVGVDRDLLKKGAGFCLGILLARVYFNSDIVLLNLFFDERESGVYASLSIVFGSLLMIRGMVMSAMLPYFSQQSDEMAQRQLSRKIVIYGCLASGLAFAVLWLFGPRLVELAFGSAYGDARNLPVLLMHAATLVMLCAFTPISLKIQSRGMSNGYILCTAVGVLVNVTGNLVFMPVYGMLAAGATTFAAELVSGGCGYLLVRRNDRERRG